MQEPFEADRSHLRLAEFQPPPAALHLLFLRIIRFSSFAPVRLYPKNDFPLPYFGESFEPVHEDGSLDLQPLLERWGLDRHGVFVSVGIIKATRL
jgi:hypothetical protein